MRGVEAGPKPDRVHRVLHSWLNGVVRFGLGGFRRDAPGDLSFDFDDLSTSDLRTISLNALPWYLRRTVTVCAELREAYPALERPYRRRRRWVTKSALTLAEGRLFASCRRVLGGEITGSPTALLHQTAAVLATCSLGLGYRLLHQFLAFPATAGFRHIDDTAVRVVVLLLTLADRRVQTLDRIAESVEARRQMWVRLEVSRSSSASDEASALSQARQEIEWACPTRMSMLILLSTLRDNNSGTYRHPALSRKFAAATVNETLARIHRETYEELLQYSFSELVYELGLYAEQTRADHHNFLRNWRGIRAYRTARPTGLDLFAASFFELTFDLAVAALGRGTNSHKASYVPNPGRS